MSDTNHFSCFNYSIHHSSRHCQLIFSPIWSHSLPPSLTLSLHKKAHVHVQSNATNCHIMQNMTSHSNVWILTVQSSAQIDYMYMCTCENYQFEPTRHSNLPLTNTTDAYQNRFVHLQSLDSKNCNLISVTHILLIILHV